MTTENKEKLTNTAPAIGAVILAAGYSSRMKKFKPLLPVDGMSAVERVICCAQNAGISDIALVIGYQRELLEPIIEEYGIDEAHNADFDSGMFSSIQAGVRAMKGKADGFFLMPVDCPVIRQDIFDGLLAQAKESLAAGAADRMMVPCYMGKKGHPLFIPAYYFDEILSHDGTNGLKGVTDKYDDKLDRIEVESESVILDMDDEEGYEEVCAYAEGGFKEIPLSELAAGRRFILLRHGQIKQHKEKIFLGQTDVPLSELGRQQAAEAGEKLKAELSGAGADGRGSWSGRIYTSDLSRASETAEIVASKLESDGTQRVDVIMEPGFREMALGEWDGKYISEIKEKYPEAYERRGRDIFKFKIGNNSENFYDLGYRVLKTLKKILGADKDDIFIVAHRGVIQMISCALTGRDPKDRWPDIGNGEYLILDL